jgi:hypothetical protein
MNYKIVKDEKLLRDFIEWLPELKEHEKYYFCLFARNKYCKELSHIKSDKAQLKRFVTDKERMFQKIKQLEIEVGWYMQREFPVPESALALYVTVNPRNMFKATVNTMCKLANSIRDQNVNMNAHQEALSEIQKSKSRTCWIDFDIDYPNEIPEVVTYEDKKYTDYTEFIKYRISQHVNGDAVTLLKTRGGLHCLIDPNKVEEQFKKTFYVGLSKMADQNGDQMIPVPGCTQGMFIPHFINL